MPKPHGEHGLRNTWITFLLIASSHCASEVSCWRPQFGSSALIFRGKPQDLCGAIRKTPRCLAPALSLDTPTVAVNGVVTVFQQGVRCASLTFLAPLLPRNQGPCILLLRASDQHFHLEECFHTSVYREPRHRLIHRQSRRSLSRPANRSK